MSKKFNEQLELPFEEEKNKVNSLNSILLEGNLSGDPLFSDGKCIFDISVRRNEKINIFRIISRTRLAEACHEYLKSGRGVRIVGRLDRDENNEICLETEHVEFKPKSK